MVQEHLPGRTPLLPQRADPEISRPRDADRGHGLLVNSACALDLECRCRLGCAFVNGDAGRGLVGDILDRDLLWNGDSAALWLGLSTWCTDGAIHSSSVHLAGYPAGRVERTSVRRRKG